MADAAGFYLNVSNYQFSDNNVQYGSWISSCIAYATEVAPGDFFNCPNQYWNGGPHPAKIADLLGEWTGVALDRFGGGATTPTTRRSTPPGSTSATGTCSVTSSRQPTT